MSKFRDASDDVIDLINLVKNGKISDSVTFRVLCNDKQKSLCEITKASELWNFASGIDFVITVNERAFDKFGDENLLKIRFEELLTGVIENEKGLSIEKPDFNTYSGMLIKYGHESIIRMKEAEKSVFDQIKEEEDAEKAVTAKTRN